MTNSQGNECIKREKISKLTEDLKKMVKPLDIII